MAPRSGGVPSGQSSSFSASHFYALDVQEVAQDPEVEEAAIRFANGDDAGAEQGLLDVLGEDGAKAGQHMSVRISGSNNANFNVFAPGGEPGAATALGSGYVGGDWSAELPASGQYSVQVYQPRATARRGTAVPYSIELQVK